MNILILGSGGREHSLAWAVLQNPKCDRLIVAPGNAGIAQIAECAALDIEDGTPLTWNPGNDALRGASALTVVGITGKRSNRSIHSASSLAVKLRT